MTTEAREKAGVRERGAAKGLDPLRIVHNDAYTAEAFELEKEHIFRKLWSFVCHESEIREPGQFITKVVADEPILVTRDEDGRLQAFYNVCRHRGSIVAPEEKGQCKTFRCPYHWWTYSLKGELLGVPGIEAYEDHNDGAFSREDYPLVPIRVDSILGLVFVCLNPDIEPLADYLGQDMIDVLRTPLANGEYEVIYHQISSVAANWKGWAENTCDGYHVPFVHPFFRKASPPREYHLWPNGHCVQYLGMDPAGIEPELWDDLKKHTLPGVETGDGYIVIIFPDLTISLRSNMVSVDGQMLSTDGESVLESRLLGLVGDSEEMRAIRRKSWDTWFGDPVSLEDKPVLEGQQRGLLSRGVTTSLIARGSPATTGTRGDDNRLRHFWARWRHLMGTSSNSIRR